MEGDEPTERTVEAEEEGRRPTPWQPALWARVVPLALIAAYLIAFVVANTDQARISFVFWTARTSLIWVILLALLAGVVGGLLLSQLYRRSHRD